MRESFSESTEAITHDSDPRYLTFERLSTDPAKQTGEGQVTEVIGIELPLYTIESGNIPAVVGPEIGDLTGGVSAGGGPEAVSFDMLTIGATFFQIAYTDSSPSDTITINSANLKALADSQSQGSASFASLDLTTLFDLSTKVGKTIDTVYCVGHTDWNSSNPTGLNTTHGESFIGPLNVNSLLGPQIMNSQDMTSSVAATNGPGLGIIVGATDKLLLTVNLVGNNATSTPNSVTLELQPPVTNDDLVTGEASGIVSVTYTLDDASTVGPFTMSSSQLKAFADANPPWNTKTNIVLTSSELGWDTSPIIGHSIVSVDINITEPFSSSGYTMGSASEMHLSHNSVVADVPGLTIIADHSGLTFADGPLATAPDFTISIQWVADPSTYAEVKLNLDAASILSFASPAQKLTQSNVVDMYNTLLTTSYLGWFMGGISAQNMVSNYGSSHTPTIQEPSQFALGFTSNSSGGLFGSFDPLNVAGTWSPTNVERVIASDARLQVGMDLFPKDTPSETYGSNVLTVPYEVKNRNLAGFKFHVYGPGPTVPPESFPTFDVIAFVSQGTPAPEYDKENVLREWTNIPVNFTDNNNSYIDNQVAQMSVAELYQATAGGLGTASLPDNFGGAMVLVSKNFIGPWNYIRFAIVPSTGFHNADYDGYFLTITANAREVI